MKPHPHLTYYNYHKANYLNSVVPSYLSPTPVGVGVGTSLIWGSSPDSPSWRESRETIQYMPCLGAHTWYPVRREGYLSVPGHSILYLFSDRDVQILEAWSLAGRVRARHCLKISRQILLLVCFIWNSIAPSLPLQWLHLYICTCSNRLSGFSFVAWSRA